MDVLVFLTGIGILIYSGIYLVKGLIKKTLNKKKYGITVIVGWALLIGGLFLVEPADPAPERAEAKTEDALEEDKAEYEEEYIAEEIEVEEEVIEEEEVPEEYISEEIEEEEIVEEEQSFNPSNIEFSNNVELTRYAINESENRLVLDFYLSHNTFRSAIHGIERAVGDIIEEQGAHTFDYIRVTGNTTGYDSLGDSMEFLLISFEVPQRTIDAIYRNGMLRVDFQPNVDNLFIHQSAQ